MSRKGADPERLRAKNHVYEFVEDGNTNKKLPINIILRKYVKNIGYPGDVISLRPNYAYYHYIITGVGVYDNPENREKYVPIASEVTKRSPFIQRTMETLKQADVDVILNQIVPWTLEPWHVRAALRKVGIFISNDTQIELPSIEIAGPDLKYENKLFYCTVTINKEEKVKIRCRLRHWCSDIRKRLKPNPDYKQEEEYIFLEDAAEAENRKTKKNK